MPADMGRSTGSHMNIRAGRKLSIGLIVACQSTQAIAFGVIALFLPLIREDIDLTFSQAGMLAVASTLTYAVMQIPSGYLADRFGPRRLFVVGLLGTNAIERNTPEAAWLASSPP